MPEEEKNESRFPLLDNLREGLKNRLGRTDDEKKEIELPQNPRYPADIVIRWRD